MLLKRTSREAKLAGCKLWICSTCSMKFKSRELLVTHLKSHISKSQSRNKQIKCKVKIGSSLQGNRKRACSKGSEEGNCSGQQSLEKPMDGITSVNRKRSRSKSIEDGKCSSQQSREKPKHVITSVAIKKESADGENCKRESTKEGNHFCRHCKKTFSSVSSLGVHLKMHNGETPYICDACGMRFILLASFNNHTKNQVCMQKKSDKNSFVKQNEMNNKSPMLKHACKWCPRRYRYPSDLARHSKSHEKKVACKRCWQICNGHTALKEHMFKAHGLQFKRVLKPVNTSGVLKPKKTSGVACKNTCNVCKEKFSSPFCLSVHMITHRKRSTESTSTTTSSDIKPNICDVCFGVFKNKTLLDEHKVEYCSRNKNSYPCNECGKVYKYRHGLTRHSVHHKDVKPFVCDVCHKVCEGQIELNRHQDTHNNKNYECDICQMTFRFRIDLRTHKKEHAPQKNMGMEEHRKDNSELPVDKTLGNNENLKFPPGRFNTNTAGNTSFDNSDITSPGNTSLKLASLKAIENHKQSKTREGKPGKLMVKENEIVGTTRDKTCKDAGIVFEVLIDEKANKNSFFCNVCKQNFPSLYILKNHIGEVHNKESFICHACKQIFPSDFYLKRHIGRDHKNAPRGCHICKKSFKSYYLLNKHTSKNHRPSVNMVKFNKSVHKKVDNMNDHCSAGSFSPNLADLGELSTDMRKITDIDDGLGSHDSSNNYSPFMPLDNNNYDFSDDVDDHASVNSFSEDLDGAECTTKYVLGKTTRGSSVSRELVDSPRGCRSKYFQNANDGTGLLKKSQKSLSHLTHKLSDQTANHPQALDENSGKDSRSDRTMYKANDGPKNVSESVCSDYEEIECFKCGDMFVDINAYRFHAPCSSILIKSGDEADGVRPVLNIAIQRLDDKDNNSVTNTEVLVMKNGRESAARGVTTNSASDSEGKDNATGGIRTINANDSETNLSNKVVTNKGKDSAARLITRNSISDFATSLNDGEVTNIGKYSAAEIVTRNSDSDFATSLNDEVAANEAGGMTPNSAGESEASFNEVVACPKGISAHQVNNFSKNIRKSISNYEGVFCCKCAVKFTDIKAYASHEPCSNTKKKVENKTCDVQRVVNKASPNLDNANQSNNNVPNSACLNNNDGTNNVCLVANQGKDTAARGNTASSASNFDAYATQSREAVMPDPEVVTQVQESFSSQENVNSLERHVSINLSHDKGNLGSLSSSCSKGNQESSSSLCNKGNQESFSSLCNKGNQESSSSLCNKGNQESSSSLCNKGNQESSSSLCNKENQESSSSMCNKGNQESSFDKDNLEFLKNYKGISCSKCRIDFGNVLIYRQHIRNCCEKSISKQANAEKSTVESSNCLDGGLGSLNVKENTDLNKGVLTANFHLNDGEDISSRRKQCSSGYNKSIECSREVSDLDSMLNDGEDISCRNQRSSGDTESTECSQDVSDTDSLLNNGEGISSKRRICITGGKESTKFSKEVSDSLLNVEEGISYNRRIFSSGDKESTNFIKEADTDSLLTDNKNICTSGIVGKVLSKSGRCDEDVFIQSSSKDELCELNAFKESKLDIDLSVGEIAHRDLSPVTQEASANPVEISPNLERLLCKGTFGEDSRLESTQEVCPNTCQLGINMESEDDDISVILVRPKGKRKEMQCVEMPSQMKLPRLFQSPISLEIKQETPIFSWLELDNEVRSDIAERSFSEAFQASYDLLSKNINEGSLGKSNASNKKAMGIAFANDFEHKVICKWMKL